MATDESVLGGIMKATTRAREVAFMAEDTAPRRRKQQRRWVDVVCEECGETFQASRRDAITCSPRCHSRRRYRIGRQPVLESLLSVTCEGCGVTFTAKRRNARFCSKACTRRTYRSQHREALLEAKLRWQRDHPEARQVILRRFAENNPDYGKRRYAKLKADPQRWAERQEYNQRYYTDNREEVLERERQKRIRDPFASRYYQHGHIDWMTLFTSLWEAQEGRCYLCGDPLDPDGYRTIHLDHDHACCPKGRSCAKCRRGLACKPCNVLIGHAKDDPDRLRRIADNLECANAGVRERMAQDQGVLFWVA